MRRQMHKACLLTGFAVVLAASSGQVEAGGSTNQVYGTWEAIEYGGKNQLPQDTKTTVTFDTNGICAWSAVFLQTNRIVCNGKFTVENQTLTFEKGSNVARFSLTYSNDCLIMREEEKDWDSWMKLRKKNFSNQASEAIGAEAAPQSQR